jgi:hypothetical protein
VLSLSKATNKHCMNADGVVEIWMQLSIGMDQKDATITTTNYNSNDNPTD